MPVGRRNRKIVVQRATVTGDGYGTEVPSWATHATLFADVRFGTGTERREAAAEQGQAAATFIVLHTATTAGITVEDRISFDGSFWDITSNVPSLRFNREREITAVRLVP